MLRVSDLPSNANQDSVFKPWMVEVISGSGVRSISREELGRHVDLTGGSRIWLNELVLLMYGSVVGGGKAIWFINIAACERSLMEGPHLVSVIGHDPLWVRSLHTWRRQAFGICDLLSFERSVFAIIPSAQRLVRIKTIRSWCELPATNPPVWNPNAYITKRTTTQLASYMDKLITSYLRDGQTNDVVGVVEHIKCDVYMYLCKSLRNYYGQPNYSDFVEDMLVWRSTEMSLGMPLENSSLLKRDLTGVAAFHRQDSTQSGTSHETEAEEDDRDCKRQKLVPVPLKEEGASARSVQGASTGSWPHWADPA